jgi:hypothetical protein
MFAKFQMFLCNPSCTRDTCNTNSQKNLGVDVGKFKLNQAEGGGGAEMPSPFQIATSWTKVDELQRLVELADFLESKAAEARAAAAQLLVLRSRTEGLLD